MRVMLKNHVRYLLKIFKKNLYLENMLLFMCFYFVSMFCIFISIIVGMVSLCKNKVRAFIIGVDFLARIF